MAVTSTLNTLLSLKQIERQRGRCIASRCVRQTARYFGRVSDGYVFRGIADRTVRVLCVAVAAGDPGVAARVRGGRGSGNLKH